MEPLLNLIGIIAGVCVSFAIGYKQGHSKGQSDEYNEQREKIAKQYSHMNPRDASRDIQKRIVNTFSKL